MKLERLRYLSNWDVVGFFGAGVVANKVAHDFCTPSATIVAGTLTLTEVSFTPEVSQSSTGFDILDVSSAGFFQSSLGVDMLGFVHRVEAEFEIEAPRLFPPRPRSVPRPRPPRLLSNPALPPLNDLVWLIVSVEVLKGESLTFVLNRSFLALETSPH